MNKSFFDEDTAFGVLKQNSEILSAINEVSKAKGFSFEPGDDITLLEIAKILGVDKNDLLLIINEKNGTVDELFKAYPQMLPKEQKNNEPKWLDDNEILDLDVRQSLANGVDPFGMIMQNIAQLNGKVLHIINTFETAPLYSVLGKQGFEHYSKKENDIWHIYFYKV